MAALINLLVGGLIIVVALWVLNIVLSRLNLPSDVLQIIHAIVAVVIVAIIIGWALGAIPGVQPLYVVPKAH
jgi:hypothetical protein